MLVSAGLALGACGGGGDEVIPIDAPVVVDGPPGTDGPEPDAAVVIDAPLDAAAPLDAPPGAACMWAVSAVAINEGASAVIGVRLTQAPNGNATVVITSGLPVAVSPSPPNAVFTPATFDQYVPITISARDDVNMSDETTMVSCSLIGGGSSAVTVTAIDDD